MKRAYIVALGLALVASLPAEAFSSIDEAVPIVQCSATIADVGVTPSIPVEMLVGEAARLSGGAPAADRGDEGTNASLYKPPDKQEVAKRIARVTIAVAAEVGGWPS